MLLSWPYRCYYGNAAVWSIAVTPVPMLLPVSHHHYHDTVAIWSHCCHCDSPTLFYTLADVPQLGGATYLPIVVRTPGAVAPM